MHPARPNSARKSASLPSPRSRAKYASGVSLDPMTTSGEASGQRQRPVPTAPIPTDAVPRAQHSTSCLRPGTRSDSRHIRMRAPRATATDARNLHACTLWSAPSMHPPPHDLQPGLAAVTCCAPCHVLLPTLWLSLKRSRDMNDRDIARHPRHTQQHRERGGRGVPQHHAVGALFHIRHCWTLTCECDAGGAIAAGLVCLSYGVMLNDELRPSQSAAS